MDIARVVGATEKHNGYMEGGGYIVTWALGHLVQLALPSYYGKARLSADDLPLIPDPFQLIIRQRKTDKGMATDPAAAKQMNVIDRVFNKCTSLIVATDAGREGELIFRYIYTHAACTLPFRRLWISSLTDEAIRAGLDDLKPGEAYDNLFAAAACRAKADWLVGINASQALASASGLANNSLGRVQTPTLAMVCSRYRENRNFLPSDYWQLHITLQKGNALRQFRYVKELKEEAEAERIGGLLTPETEATITKSEVKNTHQAPPLLYDLTDLQKDCNVQLDMPAAETLAVAQSLYEKKLISYPRTGSRYIPDDVFLTVPALLQFVLEMPRFAPLAVLTDWKRPGRRSVDASKVTDHHALIVTGKAAGGLTDTERAVYEMITGRMLESFGPRCEKQAVSMEADIDGMQFVSRSVTVTSAGWRSVFARSADKDEDENSREEGAVFGTGEKARISGHSIAKRRTQPKPLFTEATLLAAMEMPCQRGQSLTCSALPSAAGIAGTETAGKDTSDESLREAMKDSGIGTPATRAAIIETLFRREYMERSGKSLIPTEKGLFIYDAVKDMRIADPLLTGEWEKALASIEAGDMTPDTFLEAINIYARQVTAEVLSLKFPKSEEGTIPCPKCGGGKIVIRHKLAKCNNDKCGLLVFRKFLNKELTDQHFEQLLSSGTTKLIKGFKGKKNKTFDAMLTFDDNYNLTFSFPPKGSKPSGKPKAAKGGRK